MSDAVRQQLHELATAYAAGELHQSAYRARRAALLDALVGLPPLGEGLESTRPRIYVPAPAQPSATEPTRPRAAVTSPAPKGSSGRWIGLVVLVLLAGAFAFWWHARAPSGEGTAPTAGAPGAAPSSADPSRLVGDFLAQDDWSDSALSQFNASWWRLSDAQVAAILTAPGTQALRTAIATHLHERASLDPSAPIVLLARNLNVEIPAGTVSAFAPGPAAGAPATTEASGTPRTSSTRVASAGAPGAEVTGSGSNAAPASPKAPAAPRPAAINATVAAPPAATPAPSAPPPQAAADPCRSARRGLCHDTLPGGLEGPKLVLISAGAFAMGSMAHPEEQPVHQVTVAKPFAVTINEISLGEYRDYCTQPGHECPKQPWEGEKRPVVNVSWSDAVDYAKWLSQATGEHYRLPTEAEWEYVARAGTTGDFWSDKPLDLSQAYFASAAAAPAAPAELSQGGFNANPWGVLHIAGNVREWVADAWSPNYDGAPTDGSAVSASGDLRVVRGGSYHDALPKLRSAAREKLSGQTRDAYTGIRLVRELTP
jgi:formylglycine-generating enzyme required for sulfatase activity